METSIVNDLYQAREEITQSRDLDAFLSTWMDGRYKIHERWVRHYYESYRKFPELFFERPLVSPHVTKINQVFDHMVVRYHKKGTVPTQSKEMLWVKDTLGIFWYDEPEYYVGTPFVTLRSEVLEKRMTMWGSSQNLSYIEIYPSVEGKMMILGRDTGVVNYEQIAIVDMEKVELL